MNGATSYAAIKHVSQKTGGIKTAWEDVLRLIICN